MNTPRNQQPTVARAPREVKPSPPPPAPSLVTQFALKLGVEPEKMLATLRATAFRTGKNDPPVTNEEMLALLVVANEYGLNPFLKEIYAFRDTNKGGVIPIIGVDGWIRLVQSKVDFQGVEFEYDDDGAWVECVITRTGKKEFRVREYLEECRRNTGPWASHPRRMLRHRALIQCIRLAYGFGGVYEEDEGEAIAQSAGVDLLPMSRTHTQPPMARTAEDPPPSSPPILFATEDQLEHLAELLSKTGVPDNLVLAKFEVGAFSELNTEQMAEVYKFVQDQAP